MRIVLLSFIVLSLIIRVDAQQKGRPGGKGAVAQAPALKKLLTYCKYAFEAVNDSVYTISYYGDNIEHFDLAISRISDLYVFTVDLTEAMKLELKPDLYEVLLRSNDAYDMVKPGISNYNNHLYLRTDIYANIVTADVMKKLVTQMSAVTDIVAGELKKK